MELSIVVLAAGQGSRMKSPLPKVLHTIGGRPMLDHVLKTARALEPKKIIVVHGFEGEQVRKHFLHFDLDWVFQEKQLGTGDAVATALPLIPLNHRVLILYGDVPIIAIDTLKRLLRATPQNAVGLLTVNAADPTGLGRIIRDLNGDIIRIVEEKDANEAEKQIHEVNTGIFAVPSGLLAKWLPALENNNAQGEYYLTDIIRFAVKDQVQIISTVPSVPEEVLGVNDKAQQVALERFYQKRQAQRLMSEGVWIADPYRFDLRGDLEVGEDVKLDINIVLEGRNKVGRNTEIGPNCYIKNCEIADDVKILANCHLENATIASGCVVGPFARLRPGTILAQKVGIGNFVEIKNTKISRDSKVNHLSYLGDAKVGERVNVGAGTITCNYDGAHKHPTIIEDDVHIGSDTQLVAPVVVKKGATIGAGSTLTKDAEAGVLTVTHALNQRPIKGWKRPIKNKTDLNEEDASCVESQRV
ncbi:MAG: bifunctional UDP-N-acetylglucosamine diphosphorylase/glucosamine-1-phosphate N-acetyltransferase GlmU [Gammaproteobacteria bacterium]